MVTAAPKEMMPEIMRSCKMDICAFYADEVDSAKLAAFFREVSDIDPGTVRVLFLNKDQFCLINDELENCIEECFTLPLDSHDFMMRLRRMARTAAAKNTVADVPSPHVNIEEVPDSRQEPEQTDSVPEFLMKIRQMAKTAGTKNAVADIPPANVAIEPPLSMTFLMMTFLPMTFLPMAYLSPGKNPVRRIYRFKLLNSLQSRLPNLSPRPPFIISRVCRQTGRKHCLSVPSRSTVTPAECRS